MLSPNSIDLFRRLVANYEDKPEADMLLLDVMSEMTSAQAGIRVREASPFDEFERFVYSYTGRQITGIYILAKYRQIAPQIVIKWVNAQEERTCRSACMRPRAAYGTLFVLSATNQGQTLSKDERWQQNPRRASPRKPRLVQCVGRELSEGVALGVGTYPAVRHPPARTRRRSCRRQSRQPGVSQRRRHRCCACSAAAGRTCPRSRR